MNKSQILSLHKKLIDSKITINEVVNKVKQTQNKLKDTNTIITSTINLADIKKLQDNLVNEKDNLLYAIPYSLKDNIATENIKTTGGSLFLKDFIPPYSATVYELLKAKNGILTSKVNLDEFGLGGTGIFSAFGIVRNIYNSDYTTAGSSSGSVNAVASGESLYSIGTDTGDSIRRPASFVGVVGFKPSYGLVSRYGVYPYAPSLDHVGVLAQYVTDVAIVFETIAAFDDKDMSSQQNPIPCYYKCLTPMSELKIGVIKGIESHLASDVKELYLNAIKQLKANGHKIIEKNVDWSLIETIGITYKIISYAEATSCYANMTGICFGTNFDNNIRGFEKIIKNNRSKGFGRQLKRRFIIGEYLTSAENYFDLLYKSRKCRQALSDLYDSLCDGVDVFINPGASSTAFKINNVINKKVDANICDDIQELGNFSGSPSITIPVGLSKENNLPFGITINAKYKEDQKLLNVALTMETIFDFKQKENQW
ncbi:MAG: aspartyl/glutamyl-tRNA amidotransferase subunit A [Candidatus Malacoplasma girerdii]|nr:MAG: aspartyl/glutamyl-tRNA amidotransferase subunit A [Candidatus Malacoplasma girerdii]